MELKKAGIVTIIEENEAIRSGERFDRKKIMPNVVI
jgi:hypothetical protein